MFNRKYQVIATHKITKARFVVFEGRKIECVEKILRITAKKRTSLCTINGESVWHYNFSLKRVRR